MNDDTNKATEAESEVAAEDVVTDEVATDEVATDEVATDEVATDEVATDDAATEVSVADDAGLEESSEEAVAEEAGGSPDDGVAPSEAEGQSEAEEDTPRGVRTGPIEEIIEEEDDAANQPKQWYILKVQVNREDSIRDALARRVKIEGLDDYFGEIIVPTEDVVEFTKSGKRKVVKKKLYPGYILVNMVINDDSWFLVRETPGIGDFTGSAGKPTPMEMHEVERILALTNPVVVDEETDKPRVNIPFVVGDRVRVKEGNFENFEGAVDGLDESNGRVIVMINIFGRQVPVEFEHWQIEKV
jgi:transcriptional antiterminator NusG